MGGFYIYRVFKKMLKARLLCDRNTPVDLFELLKDSTRKFEGGSIHKKTLPQ